MFLKIKKSLSITPNHFTPKYNYNFQIKDISDVIKYLSTVLLMQLNTAQKT